MGRLDNLSVNLQVFVAFVIVDDGELRSFFTFISRAERGGAGERASSHGRSAHNCSDRGVAGSRAMGDGDGCNRMSPGRAGRHGAMHGVSSKQCGQVLNPGSKPSR